MQMKDALSGISSRVDDDAKAAVGDSLLAREPCRDLKNLSDQRVVLFSDIRHADQMLARNDQNMHRRFGRNIFERDDEVVLINQIGLNFTVDDAAEKTIVHDSTRRFKIINFSLLVIRCARQTRVDLAVVDFDRQTLQRQTDTGSPNAFARGRLENRAMRGAHNVAAIRTEKLIVHPVERDAGVRAAIDVGEVIALIINQQRFEITSAAPHGKLLAGAMLELAN